MLDQKRSSLPLTDDAIDDPVQQGTGVGSGAKGSLLVKHVPAARRIANVLKAYFLVTCQKRCLSGDIDRIAWDAFSSSYQFTECGVAYERALHKIRRIFERRQPSTGRHRTEVTKEQLTEEVDRGVPLEAEDQELVEIYVSHTSAPSSMPT